MMVLVDSVEARRGEPGMDGVPESDCVMVAVMVSVSWTVSGENAVPDWD